MREYLVVRRGFKEEPKSSLAAAPTTARSSAHRNLHAERERGGMRLRRAPQKKILTLNK